MAITRVSFVDMSKEEWIEQRKRTVGGSDAGTVIGFNPYKSAYALWAEKTGRLISEDISDKESVRLGHDLEQYVADRWMEATGKKLRKDNNFVYNDEYPFAHVQADRLVVGERAGFEAKTTSDYRKLEKLERGEYDDTWYAQCVHGMAITGFDKWYLGVLVFGRGFYHFEIKRNQEEIDALMKAESDFWHLVETDKPPAADGSDSTSDTISALYPESNGESVDLFAYESDLKEYMALTAQIKALTALKDEKANIIKEYMKDAGRGESSCYKVSYVSSERKTFDAKKFAAFNSGINLDPFYKTTVARAFKVSEK